jgi:hypothetical protein
MTKFIRLFPLFALPLLLSGCVSNSITNLTPAELPRNDTGLYPVEAMWRSNQKSEVTESVRSYVVVGLESYPMRPTPLISDRWETLVPVTADKDHIYYRLKFDYDYKGMPARRSDSKLSPQYRLDIRN